MGPAGAAPFVEAPLTPSQRPSAKRPCRREEIVSAGGRYDELDVWWRKWIKMDKQ